MSLPLLFLPDSRTFIWLQVDCTAGELTGMVERGEWQPPEPYTHLAARLLAYTGEGILIVSAVSIHPAAQTAPAPRLSRRRREILKGVCDGLTARQIAHRLGLHPRTIYYQIEQVKRILGVSSRAALILAGRRYLGS